MNNYGLDAMLNDAFRGVFNTAPHPIKPSDDEKDPQQKPVPVSQEGGE